MNDIGIKIGLQGLSVYKAGLRDASKSTTSFASSVGASLRNATKDIPILGQAISTLTNPIGAITAGLTGAGAAAVSFVNAAGKAESTKAAFKVLVGSAQEAEKVLKSLAGFAASTPFQLPEIQGAARKLLAFGTSADSVTKVVERLGNISAGVQAPLGDIADIYGKIQVQGRVFAEDINQLTGRGIPIIQELANQFGVSSSKVKELVTAGKVGFPEIEQAFISLTSEGGKFNGLIDALSKTFEGKVSTLKDNIQALAIQFGEVLLPAAISFVDASTSIVKQLRNMEKFAKDNAVALSAAGAALAAIVTSSIVGQFAALTKAIQAAGGASAFFTATLQINPIVLFVTVIGTLITVFVALYKEFEIVRNVTAGVLSIFKELGDIIKNNIIDSFNSLKAAFESFVNLDFRAGLGKLWDSITSGFNAIPGVAIATNGKRLGGAFKEGFEQNANLESFLREISDATVSQAQDIQRRTAQAFSEGLIDSKGFQEINTALVNRLKALEEAGKEAANKAGENTGRTFGKSFARVAIEKIATDIPAFIESNASKITKALDAVVLNPLESGKALESPGESQIFAAYANALGVNIEFLNSNFATTADLLDTLDSKAFKFGQSLGVSVDKALRFTQVVQEFKQQAFAATVNQLGSSFQSLGKNLAESIRTGRGATDAIKGFLGEIIAFGLRYLGLFLLQGATALGFPAGIPMAIAGALLLGASGVVSGLLGSSGSSSQSVASPSDSVAGNFSQGGANQQQAAPNFGLSNIQQAAPTNNIAIYVDGQEITAQVTANIETNNQLSGSGRN